MQPWNGSRVPTPIRYEVDLQERARHLVRVRMAVPAELAGRRLLFPTWTPGSYVMRDYVHHLQQISATAADGSDLAVHADTHTTFELADHTGEVTVEYELYANELTVRTNHVDDHHALLVAPATFLLVEDGGDRPHVVTVLGDDPVFSLLPDGDEPGTFTARDADHLVDSAFEVGDHPHVSIEVAGVEHEIIWTGHAGAFDLDRVAGDLRAVAEAAVDLFGGELPSPFYRFLVTAWDGGGGGLEHQDGSVLMIPSTTFGDDDGIATFQSLMTHEYLHLWNVKRLTPRELVHPDPIGHSQTRQLWIAEGWTSYYDELLPLRAGLWTTDAYLKRQGTLLDGVLERPGARLQSPADASWHAWTGLYVRDENSINAGVNYYSHGAVLAWCLDLLLRQQDPTGDGLDQVLRLLWSRHAMTDEGYTHADVVAAVDEVAGTSLTWFFDEHVTAPGMPPIEDLVEVVGLEVTRHRSKEPTPNLGVVTTESDQGYEFAAVHRDGPAWSGGVTGGDRLIAVDGHVVPRGKLANVLREHRPGDTVDVAVTRGPRLLALPVTLGEPHAARRLAPVRTPSTDQRAAFRQWTGHDLPDRS